MVFLVVIGGFWWVYSFQILPFDGSLWNAKLGFIFQKMLTLYHTRQKKSYDIPHLILSEY